MRIWRWLFLTCGLIATASAVMNASTSGDRTDPAAMRPVVGAPELETVRRLALQVYRPARFGDEQLRAVMSQVEQIWQPYGFEISWSEGVPSGPAPDVFLRVVIAEERPAGDASRLARSTIGWIEFLGLGRPRDVVRVSVGAARRMMEATRLFGRPLSERAPALQDRFITHALGRSLAHEIGHYLFATTDHTANGLMRPQFSPAELLESGLDGYRLDPG